MNSPATIDASVFVSAFSPAEPAHPASKAFMIRVRDESTPIIVPALVLPEVASAIARGQGKPELGVAFAQELSRFPNLTLISVDESLANLAVEVSAHHRLRGSDAIYASVALRYGTELITLDREQLERLPEILPVRAP
jgi:predicted nucleic acid-binding protein